MLDKTIFTTTILLLQTAAKHRVLLNGVLLEESSLAPDELLSLLQQVPVAHSYLRGTYLMDEIGNVFILDNYQQLL